MNLVKDLVARIEKRLTQTKKPCKLFSTEDKAEAIAEIEGVKDEEQEAYDNLSEGFQAGERGDAMQAAVNSLEEALSSVQTAIAEIENALR